MESKAFNLFEFLTPKGMTQFINEDSSVRQALEKFDAHKFTVVPVINKNGDYINTISEGDLLRYLKRKNVFNLKEVEDESLNQIERYRPYEALSIDCTLLDVLSLSLNQNFIPIVDDRNKFIGIIKRRDVLSFLISEDILKK